MYFSTNLTAAESLRLYGAVPECTLQRLIDQEKSLADAQECVPLIEEASAQFPAEDFLAKYIKQLHEIAKTLRGNNKDALHQLASDLTELQQETFHSSEYGRDELHKAINSIRV